MHRIVPLLLSVSLLSVGSSALAQSAAGGPARGVAARLYGNVHPGLQPSTAAAVSPAARTPALPGPPAGQRLSGTGPVFTTVAGALAGAWVGYMVSQAIVSSWDETTDGEAGGFRLRLALGGSALGGIAGYLFGRHGAPVPAVQPTGVPARGVGGSTDVITREDIRRSGATSVYELVESLRPAWLRRDQGISSFTEQPDIVADADGKSITVRRQGLPGLKVYLNDALLGGVAALRDIPVEQVVSVRYLDPAQATYRWGGGHPKGAILVSTRLER